MEMSSGEEINGLSLAKLPQRLARGIKTAASCA
jgi:hypothetical protein